MFNSMFDEFKEVTFRKSIDVFSVKYHRSIYCIFEMFMTSIYEEKMSVEVRLIHAEQMSLYNFIILRKNNGHRRRLNNSSKTF